MEINKLQKENHRLREECQELRADLEEAEDRLASGEAENNRLLQELEEARSVIDRFKATLERRVEEVRLEERRSMGSSVLHFE
jgi:peptidoglycan hydrolase CwlO-like protein